MIESMLVQFISDTMNISQIQGLICLNILIGIYFYYLSTKDKSPYQYLLERPTNYKATLCRTILEKDLSEEPLYHSLDEYCKTNNIYKDGVIVSLSGGVDSMVTFAILLNLKQKHNFPLYTATIDYNLRKESNDESEFIKEYVSMFNIKPTIKYVEGISRKKDNSGSRSEFEEASRALRFNTYKQIMIDNNMECGVMVAHHMDDIIENIFTNSMQGANIMDIEVMKSVSTIHGVKMFRPFLAFKKDMIYNFAHKYDVPYFKDTTPKWSRRGQMRFEIFPLLDKVFGLGWRDKLKDIGTQSNQWGEYIDTYVIKPWLEEVVVSKDNMNITFPIKNQPQVIYNIVIMKTLHSIGQRMLKRTSMEKIMNNIKNPTSKKISLDGNRYAIIDNNNIVILL